MSSKSQGYLFKLVSVSIFGVQNGISKYLGTHYPPILVAMIRYWVFAAFVILLARRSGGIVKAASSKRPFLQLARSIMLAMGVVFAIFGLSRAGLATAQSVFQGEPLLVTALSVPILGERIDWHRWLAIIIGLCGVLLIINPVNAHFDANILFAVAATFTLAIYAVTTRAVSKDDGAVTSVFYTGIIGFLVLTVVGVFYMVPIALQDMPWMAVLCICGVSGHCCLICAYHSVEASELQPLTYFQLVIGAFIATLVFHETLTWTIIAGAFIVVSAGLFSMFRERSLSLKRTTSSTTP
jgi:drug/metabolite transporter (DMT)-like permease